jgi:hypothetical protein
VAAAAAPAAAPPAAPAKIDPKPPVQPQPVVAKALPAAPATEAPTMFAGLWREMLRSNTTETGEAIHGRITLGRGTTCQA